MITNIYTCDRCRKISIVCLPKPTIGLKCNLIPTMM